MNHERFQVIFLSQGAHFGTLRAAQIVGRPLARTGRKNLKCTAAQTIGPFGCILNPSCNRCVNADPAGGAVRRSFRPREFENVLFAGDGAGHNITSVNARRASAPHQGEICALRFCCQHASSDWLQTGYSLPHPTANRIWVAGTPMASRTSRAAIARRSESATLYAIPPRSSASPSITMKLFGCAFSHLASAWRTALCDRLLLFWIERGRLWNGRILHRTACVIFAIILIRNSLCGQVGLPNRTA